jgi:hypothetical protein
VVNVFATAGTGDAASLYDSSGADQFYGTATGATLLGTGYTLYLQSFKEVNAFATAGTGDSAVLYDSAGVEQFYGTPTGGTLLGTNFVLYVQHFDQVAAIATPGTGDGASLFGSAGAEGFYGTPTGTTLLGTGYNLYVQGCDAVSIFAGGGADDVYLYDDPAAADVLSVAGDKFDFTTGGRPLHGSGLGATAHLRASSTGGGDTLFEQAVDYLFEKIGEWTPG